MSYYLDKLLFEDENAFRGIVYFLEGNDAIKIGYTTHLGKRLADLNTSSPFPITLCEYARADKQVERELHKLLASERLNGEWFKASDKVWDMIELVSAFLEMEFSDEVELGVDGRDSHILTVEELREIVARPYYWDEPHDAA